MKAPPERTCVGCGRKSPQSELLRFGSVDGRLTVGRTIPGRGVYTCRRLVCFERAVASRGFSRVLRRTVLVEPELARHYTDS
ncbi:MAG: YlxR family protein [Thermoleophilia bacterium]|nr:YlxR family protein [Thermoleophilia bacterium]